MTTYTYIDSQAYSSVPGQEYAYQFLADGFRQAVDNALNLLSNSNSGSWDFGVFGFGFASESPYVWDDSLSNGQNIRNAAANGNSVTLFWDPFVEGVRVGVTITDGQVVGNGSSGFSLDWPSIDFYVGLDSRFITIRRAVK